MTWKLALSNLNIGEKDTRIVCNMCGCKFEPERNNKHSKVRHCCAACKEIRLHNSQRAKALRYREKKRKQRDANSEPRPCQHCGTMYKPATVGQQFCSVSCASRNRNSADKLTPFKRKEEYAAA
jgi:hypothetical protein